MQEFCMDMFFSLSNGSSQQHQPYFLTSADSRLTLYRWKFVALLQLPTFWSSSGWEVWFGFGFWGWVQLYQWRKAGNFVALSGGTISGEMIILSFELYMNKIILTIKTWWHQVKVGYRTTPTSTALQWLQPEQTLAGTHPFLFSQCQAITYLQIKLAHADYS